MTRFRSFRNGDVPALADLWNRALPEDAVVRPLGPHEFDTLVVGKLGFEADGLIVAEHGDDLVGFVHAGFGPINPAGHPGQFDFSLGSIVMMAIAPGGDEAALGSSLIAAAEAYLVGRGARVIYAGGQFPVNPFYWGLYGASELSGILDSHAAFGRAIADAGYDPSARSILLEADLAVAPQRDPKAVAARRRVHVEILDDAAPRSWWEALAVGSFRPTRFRLLDRAESVVAEAWTWDIAAGLPVGAGGSRTGLIGLEVAPGFRRQGFARAIVGEVLRHSKAQFADRLAVQTAATNAAALGLYAALGFSPVGSATLYRLPAERMERRGGR